AWLACYHFMYYDVLLTALPVCVLFSQPGSYVQPIYVAVRLRRHEDDASQPPWLLNRMVPTLVLALAVVGNWVHAFDLCPTFGTPWDTYCLLALWFWCGWLAVCPDAE